MVAVFPLEKSDCTTLGHNRENVKIERKGLWKPPGGFLRFSHFENKTANQQIAKL